MSPGWKHARALALTLFMIAGCRPAGRVQPEPQGAARPASASTSIQFEDVTAAAGVRFKHFNGADGRFLLPESIGAGGAWIDFDNDGLLDLFLVNGTGWADGPKRDTHPALYRNRGDRFEDVTRQAGLAVPLQGMGCAVADYDNDGFDDLLVTCLGPNRLFRNMGDGTFRDVTRASGLPTKPTWDWHTSAAWVDYNRDGRLDLFVCRYVEWSPETDQPCKSKSGRRTYCGPEFYPGVPPLLYLNLGNGRFRDVSREAGITHVGKGLGVVPVDENGDGWPDLVVANDLVPNFLYRNVNGQRFEEVGQEAGIAVGQSGRPRAGMGIDAADVWNDGNVSVSIGNFSNEGLALFSHDGYLYGDTADVAGLLPVSLSRLTFGLLFLDADRDGRQDLFAYNGHVDPLIAEEDPAMSYAQTPLLFRNTGRAFEEVTRHAGSALGVPRVGRGCAQGDYDNDGRPDLLLCENAGPACLLRNTGGNSHHWLGVKLRGRHCNRNGYGAEVLVRSGGVTQRRWVRSGASYLSHSDPRALFGLGMANAIDSVEVKWPCGAVQRVKETGIDRYITVSEE